MSEIAFDSANAEIAGFEFSDAAKAVINTALSNYDPQTKSIIVLFNEAGIFDGVLGTLKVKVADAAPTGEIAVTAGSRVQNEAVGLVESTVTDGKISVTAKAPVIPEISGIEVTANAVEIADADKADEAKIIGAVKTAITKIAVKWTEGKEDTTVTTDDVTFSVDTQAKKVTVTYSGFKDEIAYTVAAPIVPVVTDISVDKTSIEVPYAKSEKVAQYIKDNINVKLVYDIADPEDVAKADVKVELGEGKAIVSVNGYNFTKDVTYTIGEPVLKDITVEKAESKTYEWNEAPTVEDAKNAYGKVYARYEFDNADGYIEVDVTDKAEFSVSESDKFFVVEYNGYQKSQAEYVILSAPKTLNSDKESLTYSYGTDDLAAFVKGAVVFSVEREDGTAYEIKDGDIEITVNAEKTQATVKFLPKAINDIVINLTELDREVESIVALPESMTFAWNEEVTADTVKAKIESVVATYKDGKDPASEEVDGYTVTVDGDVATVSYGGAEDAIEIIVETAPQTGIKADPEAINIPYGNAKNAADYIKENVAVYAVYADGKTGTEKLAFEVELSGDGKTATITVGEYDSVNVSVDYETKDAYIDAPKSVSVSYSNHNEKTNEEIAAYIADNKLTDKVSYVDEIGIAKVLAKGDYTVSYADRKATISYNGLTKEITVYLDSKPSSGNNVPSGTVIRPGNTSGKEDEKQPELKGITVNAKSVSIADADKDNAAVIEKAVRDAITEIKAQWTEGKADTDVSADDVTITVDTENRKAVIEYNGFEAEVAYKVGAEGEIDDSNASDLPYTDVDEDDWAYDAIKELTDKGIISGDSNESGASGTTLRPDFGITREEVSKIVLKAKGIEVDASLILDVTDPETVSPWAVGYVATAMEEGIIKGYEDGTVKGTKTVTRAELAAIIVRTLNATSDVNTYSFSDITDADWFAKEVECAKQLGIVNGYEDGSFRGNNEVTRREAFSMVYRMINLLDILQQ